MTVDEFIKLNRCEVLYHMSEKQSWSTIQEIGLMSTSALLDICDISGEERDKIERQLRRKKVPINHETYGDIYIRDQAPMLDRPSDGIFLENLLENGTPIEDWLEFLNGKIFFWVTKYEFMKMLCARLYRNKPHWIIKVDTRSLLRQYADKASVSDQNSGSLYSRRKRGFNTFIPLLECPRKSNIIELAINHGVPDITDYTISVTECIGSGQSNERVCREVKQIWP